MVTGEAPIFGKLTADPDWKIAIIRSIWYDEFSSNMVADAEKTLIAAGIKPANIRIIDAPGSFELPLLCKQALMAGADGCIAFGIIVQGATQHAGLVAGQSAAGCMQVQLELLKPITFEVLLVDILEDARVRTIGKNAKGLLAARTILSSLAQAKQLR